MLGPDRNCGARGLAQEVEAVRGERKKLIAWLEHPKPRPRSPNEFSIRAWNILGDLDWNGILPVCEMLGIDDVETLVHDLVTIRNFLRNPKED
jgi:hypothetical protein